MNYLERRAQQRLIADLDARFTRIAEAMVGKRRIPQRSVPSHLARFAFIVFMLASSAAVAWLIVALLKEVVPRSVYPAFYVGLAVASAATLVAFFKELGDLIIEFWSVESPTLPNKLRFFVKAFVAFLPLFLATYATREYFATNSKSEVNLFLSSVLPTSTGSNDALFRFNIVFGDPRLDYGEAGWRSLLSSDDVAVAIGNELHKDFLEVVGRRLRACGAIAPVEVEIVGYFSSSLWKIDPSANRLVADEDFKQALSAGMVQAFNAEKDLVTISLDEGDRREQLERHRAEIQAIKETRIGETFRAQSTAQAFNLWVAEKRASAVCRALLGLANNVECNDVAVGPIHVFNLTRASTYDQLAHRLDLAEPRLATLSAKLDPDYDERVLARSAEIIVKSAGSCEIPVNN